MFSLLSVTSVFNGSVCIHLGPCYADSPSPTITSTTLSRLVTVSFNRSAIWWSVLPLKLEIVFRMCWVWDSEWHKASNISSLNASTLGFTDAGPATRIYRCRSSCFVNMCFGHACVSLSKVSTSAVEPFPSR